MILNTILCLLLLGNLILLILVYRTVKSQPKHIGQEDLDRLQEKVSKLEQEIRSEVRATQESTTKTLVVNIGELSKTLNAQLEGVRTTFSDSFHGLQQSNEDKLDQVRQTVAEHLQTTSDTLVTTVGKLGNAQKDATNTLVTTISKFGEAQTLQLTNGTKAINSLMQTNEKSIENVRRTVNQRLQTMQDSNETKLDQMRQTVDEQLQSTLKRRLDESFSTVKNHLESVQSGLTEMRILAGDVGDLKQILANVKKRGIFGEVQLGVILEDILTVGQYSKDVQPNPSSEVRVEFAVRLPGNGNNGNAPVWLPIDSKFPLEDYHKLVDASNNADKDAEQVSTKAFIRTVRSAAKDISEKYIVPPHTTNFAIMFLATEGLYAEVLRQPGEVEKLLQDHRIIVAGPTTLAAILLSLRVGFQTLTMQAHSSKIRDILSAVKTEFREYNRVLDLTQKHLRHATNTLEKTGVRSQAVVGKLREIEELPLEEAAEKLGLPETELGNELPE